MQVPVSLAQYM